jgi:cytoskeleton protein RodZ
MNKDENAATKNNSNATATPGEILSAAREQQGLTQQQVADRLHLRLRSVKAIEADDVEEGVSSTFTKGYVRLYARLLGLHAEPLLRAFDTLHAQDAGPARLQSFSKRVAREANDSRWNMVTYIIVLLVIGSVVVWWIDQSDFSLTDSFSDIAPMSSEQNTDVTPQGSAVSQQDENFETFDEIGNALDTNSPSQVANDLSDEIDRETDNQLEISSLAQQLSPTDQNDPSIIEALPDEDSDTGENMQAAADDFTGTVTQAGNVIETAADDIQQITSTNAVSPELQTSANDAPSLPSDSPYNVNADGSVDMVFTFEEDCWVSVKDAFDETIAIGVKAKGRIMEVSGIPPINVILGAPHVVAIDFGGQSVDMTGFDGGRTANFQLPGQGE